MSCCPSNIVTFFNQEQTEITYSEANRLQFGRVPKVQVSYYDPISNDYYISNNQTSVALIGNPVSQIRVNHGGVSTGLVKFG